MQNAINLLSWQMEMGAIDSIGQSPIDRTIVVVSKPTVVKKVNISLGNKANTNFDNIPKKKNIAVDSGGLDAEKIANSCKNISDLQEAVQNFSSLSIAKTAIHTLFLSGNLDSKTLVISDVPTSDDDRNGSLLSGADGLLFSKAIRYIDLDVANLAIMPTIFWRPPGNRRPTDIEIASCRPFIFRAIELLRPELIIFLGVMGHNSLFKNKMLISKVDGLIIPLEIACLQDNVNTITVENPGILLKKGNKKQVFWNNLQKIRNKISDKKVT